MATPRQSDETVITRWTNVYATPDPANALDQGLAPNTPVTVLGRDQWGGWILVETADASGWVPRDALTLESAEGLIIVDDGAPKATGPVTQVEQPQTAGQSAEPEVIETMTITRWTNLFSKPEVGNATDVSLAPETRVVLLGAADGWIHVRHEETEGWIPNDALM